MTVQQGKQLVKNALYRSIGETSAALRIVPNGAASLRILMYHKVNDIPDNPTTVPVGRFDDQLSQVSRQPRAILPSAIAMASLRRSAYRRQRPARR